MSRAPIHRPSVTPNSAIDRSIADYRQSLREAPSVDALKERMRLFDLSETRLHLHRSEQAAFIELIARRFRELSEGQA